jgi:hypothetical protein
MSRLTLGDASYVTLAGGAALDSVHNDPGAIRLLAGGTVSGLGLAVDHHRGLKLAAVGTVVGAAIRVWTTIIGHWLAIGRLVVAAVRGRVGVGRRIGVNRTVRIGIVVVRSGTEAERECRAAAMMMAAVVVPGIDRLSGSQGQCAHHGEHAKSAPKPPELSRHLNPPEPVDHDTHHGREISKLCPSNIGDGPMPRQRLGRLATIRRSICGGG